MMTLRKNEFKRKVKCMLIKRIERGELCTNGYVAADEQSGQCAVIDCGYDVDSYVKYIEDNGLKVRFILLTHHHYDHSKASPELARRLGVDIYIHKDDISMLKKLYTCEDMKLVKMFDDKDDFAIGSMKFTAVQTKGHTRGGVFFVEKSQNIVFTGDTVFADEIGLTSLEDGSPQDMAYTCQKIVAKLPKDMIAYPGHGEETTIGYIIKENLEFREAMNMVVEER